MNKLLLVGFAVATCLAASAAQAADLRMPVTKAPPLPPPPVFTWTGCYFGGHVGGGWGRKDFAGFPFAPDGESFRLDTSGWLAGGQVGCDYQFANNWVIGIENQGSWSDIKGDRADSFTTEFSTIDATAHAKTDWLVSITGRLGVTFDRWLVYGKGGVAFAGDKYRFDGQIACTGTVRCEPPGPTLVDFSASETRVGWTAGGGVEWAFVPNWSAKVEYMFYDFGRRRAAFFDSLGNLLLGGGGLPVDVTQKIHTVKFGLNYHFWTGPAPVAARY